ncbi:MAG: hypothetical protein RPV21_06025 [Candidatus Sedimenticola sp. (ex Thyasira tokunagai)]
MKFSQLQVGQRFRLNGLIYSKSGPLQAIPEGSGNHKMIMRSAAVELLEAEDAASKATKTATLDPVALRQAIDRYHQQCLVIVESTEPPLSDEVKARLTSAYQEMTAQLSR